MRDSETGFVVTGIVQDQTHVLIQVDKGNGEVEIIKVYLTGKKQNPKRVWIGVEASKSNVKINRMPTIENKEEPNGNK